MRRNKKVTPVEWEIMEAIWKLGGAPSVRDVLEHAYPHGEKAYTTIQTIMNTLENKGFLTREKIGLVNFYSPVKSREDMVKEETNNLVSKVFKGSFPALANFLIHSDEFSLDEIAEIKRLLLEKESNLRSHNHD